MRSALELFAVHYALRTRAYVRPVDDSWRIPHAIVLAVSERLSRSAPARDCLVMEPQPQIATRAPTRLNRASTPLRHTYTRSLA